MIQFWSPFLTALSIVVVAAVIWQIWASIAYKRAVREKNKRDYAEAEEKRLEAFKNDPGRMGRVANETAKAFHRFNEACKKLEQMPSTDYEDGTEQHPYIHEAKKENNDSN